MNTRKTQNFLWYKIDKKNGNLALHLKVVKNYLPVYEDKQCIIPYTLPTFLISYSLWKEPYPYKYIISRNIRWLERTLLFQIRATR